MKTEPATGTRSATLVFVADVVLVVIFCTIGRRSHAEGITLTGVAHTSWPFLTRLRDLGRAAAAEWIAAHLDDIGRRSTVDLHQEYL